MTIYNFYRNMCTKSPVREIATIEATSIHQKIKKKLKNDKIYYSNWEKGAKYLQKKECFFVHVSSVDEDLSRENSAR